MTRKTRLIDFYKPTTSNEHPIGSVTCPCRRHAALFTLRCQLCALVGDALPASLPENPRGPKPVEALSCRCAFDDAPRALVIALDVPPAFRQIGDTSGLVTAPPLGDSRPVIGRFGELSRAS